MPQKIIRDPVHDVISFDIGEPLDGLLFSLLNCVEFQRLRRILQLGMTHLAYPGATHSRYSHSLGVMETARKMIAHLERQIPIETDAKTLCLVSALLHDLGHGPFSHVFERISGISHERLTMRLILDPAAQVHQILIGHDPLLPERVAALVGPGAARSPAPSAAACYQPLAPSLHFLRDILSSQLDADRFDYLLRDNLMTGSRYGAFDLEWLLHHLTADPSRQRLAVWAKGISAAEDYLHARYNMYRNVYFHKVVRSAEGMVKLALRRARRLAVQERLAWPPRDGAVHKALLGLRLSFDEFLDLDDVSINQCFKAWAASADDAVLARLCRGLLHRRLYKTIDLSTLCEADAQAALRQVEEAVQRAGGDRRYDVFYDQPADTPYAADERPDAAPSESILIQSAQGALTPLGELSPLPRALDQRLVFRRIHVSSEFREVAAAALGKHHP